MYYKRCARCIVASYVDLERFIVGHGLSQPVDVSFHVVDRTTAPPARPDALSDLLTLFVSLIEASLIVITGTLPTMRLFLKHIAPSLVGETEATHPSTTRRESGWELQHRGTHDPYDIEDGSSEREIFNTKGEMCG